MQGPFKTLRVLGKRVRIIWDSATIPDDQWGEWDFNTHTLHVNKEGPIDELRETVLHETLHALESMHGFTIPEATVRSMSSGLFAVLRDNKAFAKWILEESDDE